MSPESSQAMVIPYYMNDIAFNNRRGGETRVYFDGVRNETLEDDCEVLFTPNSEALNWNVDNVDEIQFEIDMCDFMRWSFRIGFAVNEGWRARNFKIEWQSADTEVWNVAADLSNFESGEFLTARQYSNGAGCNKIRVTFSNWNSDSFRMGQIYVLPFNSMLGSGPFLSRDGGGIFGDLNVSGTVSASPGIQGNHLITLSQAQDSLDALDGALRTYIDANGGGGLSESEVQALIDTAISELNPTGLTEAQVNTLINTAIANLETGLTEEQANVLIDTALVENETRTQVIVDETVNEKLFATSQTKRMTWTCGGLDQTVALSSTSRMSMGARIPVRTLKPSKRWRIKIRNYGIVSGAKQALVGKGIKHSIMLGEGNYSASTVKTLVGEDFTIPGDGSFYYSPWVTDPENQLSPTMTRVIGWGFTSPVNVSVQGQEAKWWFCNTHTEALDTAYTGQSIQNLYGMPADFQIEYEVDTKHPSGLWIGDSISAGIVGAAGGANVLQPWWESYPNMWAASRNTIINNISLSGADSTVYSDNMDPWTRVDHIGAAYDYGVIALGTNDYVRLTLATFQAKIPIIIDRMRTLCGLVGKPIFLVGPTPGNGGSTYNANRQAMDNWLMTKPNGATGYVNLQTAVAATQDAAAWQSGLSSDGAHPSYAGRELLWFRVQRELAAAPLQDGIPARNNDLYKVVTQAQFDAMAGGRDDLLYLIRG